MRSTLDLREKGLKQDTQTLARLRADLDRQKALMHSGKATKEQVDAYNAQVQQLNQATGTYRGNFQAYQAGANAYNTAPPPAGLIPKIGNFQYQPHPAEAHFEEVQQLLTRRMPRGGRVLSQQGGLELRQQQKMAVAQLGAALPKMKSEAEAGAQHLNHLAIQLQQADAAAKRGELSPRGVAALDKQVDALKAGIKVQEQRAAKILGYQKRFEAFQTTQGDEPLFDTFALPGESPRAGLDPASRAIFHLLTPRGEEAADKAQRIENGMKMRGEIPPLPPPPDLSPAGRQSAALRRNAVVDYLTRPLPGHAMGGAFGTTERPAGMAIEPAVWATWDPWMRRIAPIIQQQIAGRQKAAKLAQVERAGQADVLATGAAVALGGVGAGMAGPLEGFTARFLPREAARILAAMTTAGVGGATGAGGMTTTSALVMGKKPKEALQEGARAMPAGFVLGAGVGLGHAVTRSLLEKAEGAFRVDWDPVQGPRKVEGLIAEARAGGVPDAQVPRLRELLTKLGQTPKATHGPILKTLRGEFSETLGYGPRGQAKGASAPRPRAARAEVIPPAPKPVRVPTAKAPGPVVEAQPEPPPTREAAPEQHEARALQMSGEVPPGSRDAYVRSWTAQGSAARGHHDALTTAAAQVAQTNPQLAEKLREAAQTTLSEFNYQHRHEHLTGDQLLDEPPAVAPPQVSVWRRLSEPERKTLSPAVRRSLLVQDVSNSHQVLDPETMPAFAVPGVKSERALQAEADRLFAQAQQAHAASQVAPPEPQAQIPVEAPPQEPVPSISQQVAPPPATLPVETPQPPTTAPEVLQAAAELATVQETPAPEVTAPTAAEPITEADLQPGFTFSTPAGTVLRLIHPQSANDWVAQVMQPPAGQDVPAVGSEIIYHRQGVLQGQRVDEAQAGLGFSAPSVSPAVTPVAGGGLEAALPDIGKTGGPRALKAGQALAEGVKAGAARVRAKADAKVPEAAKPKALPAPKTEAKPAAKPRAKKAEAAAVPAKSTAPPPTHTHALEGRAHAKTTAVDEGAIDLLEKAIAAPGAHGIVEDEIPVLAQAIAQAMGSSRISVDHVAEALTYRSIEGFRKVASEATAPGRTEHFRKIAANLPDIGKRSEGVRRSEPAHLLPEAAAILGSKLRFPEAGVTVEIIREGKATEGIRMFGVRVIAAERADEMYRIGDTFPISEQHLSEDYVPVKEAAAGEQGGGAAPKPPAKPPAKKAEPAAAPESKKLSDERKSVQSLAEIQPGDLLFDDGLKQWVFVNRKSQQSVSVTRRSPLGTKSTEPGMTYTVNTPSRLLHPSELDRDVHARQAPAQAEAAAAAAAPKPKKPVAKKPAKPKEAAAPTGAGPDIGYGAQFRDAEGIAGEKGTVYTVRGSGGAKGGNNLVTYQEPGKTGKPLVRSQSIDRDELAKMEQVAPTAPPLALTDWHKAAIAEAKAERLRPMTEKDFKPGVVFTVDRNGVFQLLEKPPKFSWNAVVLEPGKPGFEVGQIGAVDEAQLIRHSAQVLTDPPPQPKPAKRQQAPEEQQRAGGKLAVPARMQDMERVEEGVYNLHQPGVRSRDVSRWMRDAAPHFKRAFDIMAGRVFSPAERGSIERVGLMTVQTAHGGDALGLNLRLPDGRQMIFANPFRQAGRGANTYREPVVGMQDTADNLARSLAAVTVHEMAHFKVRVEGAPLWEEMDRLNDLIEKEHFERAVDVIRRSFTKGGTDDFSPEYRKARDGYLAGQGESRGSSAFGDVLWSAGAGPPGPERGRAAVQGREGGAGPDRGEARQVARQEQQRAGTPPEEGVKRVQAVYEAGKGPHPKPEQDALTKEARNLYNRATRVLQYLPRGPEHAELTNRLLRLQKGTDIADLEAQLALLDMGKGLTPPQKEAFQYGRFVRDMASEVKVQEERIAEAGEGHLRLPNNLSKEDVEAASADLEQQFAKPENKAAVEALDRRKKIVDRISGDYRKSRVELTGSAPTMDREDWMHHEILKHLVLQGKSVNWGGSGEGLHTPGEPGFTKMRRGSVELYNSDWASAEHKVLARMIYDTHVYDFLNFVVKEYDLANSADLKAQARREGKRLDEVVPEGYGVYQPEVGSHFFKAWSLPDRLSEDLFVKGLSEVGVTERDLRQVLAMGQPMKQYILPTRVIRTLNEFNPKTVDDLEKQYKQLRERAMRVWKVSKLQAPGRIIAYNIRNEIGDLEAILFANGVQGTRKMLQAAVELTALFEKHARAKNAITPELRQWLKRGGLSSVLQSAEQVGGQGLALLEGLARDAEKGNWAVEPFKKLWGSYWNHARALTDFRESVGRYSTYLLYLQQIQEGGRPRNYGASMPAEINAIKNPRDKAYKMSNELLGAYDQVSQMGNLTAGWIPFWRWNEANWNRNWGLFKNSLRPQGDIGAPPPDVPGIPPWMNPRLAIFLARRALGATAAGLGLFALYGLGKFLFKAHALEGSLATWNTANYPQALPFIPERDRGRPLFIYSYDPATHRVGYTTRLGIFQDTESFLGIDNALGLAQKWANGHATKEDVARQAAESFSGKMVAFGPYQTVWELMTGKQLFPNPLEARPIRDRWEFLADAADPLIFGDAYRRYHDRPFRAGRGAALYAGKDVDTDEASFDDMRRMAGTFLEAQGKGGRTSDYNPKSDALFYHKQSLRWGDVKAANVYLERYVLLGGDDKGRAASLKTLDPLAGADIGGDLQREFLKTLAPIEEERLRRAYAFLDGIVRTETTQPVETLAPASLPIDRWVTTMRDRIEAEIDFQEPVYSLARKNPEARKALERKELAPR